MPEPRIGVVGATGAVGEVVLSVLAERGFEHVRAFASARSAGTRVAFGDGELEVEQASPDALGNGLDLCFFSVGTAASRELVPPAVAGGALCIDKSSAFRLADGIPLVVPEVNGERALEHDGIVANPNCSTIQLVCLLKPLHDAAGLKSVRLATYQSASGAGLSSMERLRAQAPGEGNVVGDWELEGDDFDEEVKLRAETRKILDLPNLPFSVTCARVPVLIGHSQSIWVETEEPLTPAHAREVLGRAPSVRVTERPTPRDAVGGDEVLVGRIREDPVGGGLMLWGVCDNLRKGAALNAVQIAELLLARQALAA
ncbi:MAG TPA: Asd/ArgC dimerization domain-containing protein [Gaiellaceae bacterium]|nr:Asd/ArgC dimerization domain-containing protein [Gaiellaceae bacterium]